MCGDLYFPSTLNDDMEIESILNDHHYETGNLVGWHWIRISNKEMEGIWKDPDNKENLTFTNWMNGYPRPGTSRHHAVLTYTGDWFDTFSTMDFTDSLLCELPSQNTE